MCEITCENFYSELPAIEAAIKKSAFIGLDMEFSKLHDDVAKPLTYFDTTEERYSILRQKVSDITCIQLGLAIFTYDLNSKNFKTCTYSFYTYPQTFYKSDSVVSFQTSCVEFLCKYKFDFNKLLHNRVPYLTDEQEKTIKSEMNDALFFDKYFETNLKFRSIEEELIKVLNIISEWYENAVYGECTDLEINGCNEPAYIILMQYYIMKRFKYVHIKENQSGLSITKIKEKNIDILNQQIYENLKQRLLDKMMGIKYIMKLISESKKPLVGHNCTLDILILCNQFFKPLPENFKDFQCFLSDNFGPIYDTKLLSKEIKRILPKNVNWINNSLQEVYLFLKDGSAKIYSDSVCIELDGIKEPQNLKLHHAGWDAYYTGYCFVKIIHLIKIFSSKTKTNYNETFIIWPSKRKTKMTILLRNTMDQKYTLTELLKSVEIFENKLYTSRSISNFIDLKESSQNNQLNILVIQNKGIFYQTLDVFKLKNDLKKICYFDIKLLSNYTALVASSSMNKRIIDSMKSEYMIENYSKYKTKKRKQYIIFFSLIICTSASLMMYIKK